MTPRLWILVLLGWLLLGPAMPAHASGIRPPRVEAGPVRGHLTRGAPQVADRVVPVRLELCQTIGRYSTRWVRLTTGAWPLLRDAGPFCCLPSSQGLPIPTPQAAHLTVRGRSSSPRAPPLSL
jgi:hypothetical protein